MTVSAQAQVANFPLPGGLHSSLFPSLQPENVNKDVPVQPFSSPSSSATVEGRL